METGKTYKIKHQRKGCFTVKVLKQDDTWTTGLIVSGTADAMLDYNKAYKGEEITFRTAFVNSAVELLGGEQ